MIYKNGSATILRIGDEVRIFIPNAGHVATVTMGEGGYEKAMEMVDNYIEQQQKSK